MTFTCLGGSVLINKIGLRYSLALGTAGYSIYSAALYQNNRHGTEWFIYFGSAACGITAGLFWAAEGAIMLSYPPPESRGRYLAYWLAYRNSGAILGGIINLAFNYSGRSIGKLDWRTYIVFVVLRKSIWFIWYYCLWLTRCVHTECLGPAVALLLSNPDKAQRRDGTLIQLLPKVPMVIEAREAAKLMLRKEFLLL